MLVPLFVMGISVTALPAAPGTASDSVTLAGGVEVRGLVVAGEKFGGLKVLVRRDWARQYAPTWLARWEREETPLILTGRRERKERLIAWRRDRAGASPRVAAWIDREVRRLSTYRPARTALTAATIPASRVVAVADRPDENGRLLRLGWLAGLKDAETLTVDDLTDALEALGPIPPDDPAAVDSLLPVYPEPEDQWRTRRAATEVTVEPGLRFVRFREFVLPETGPAAGVSPRTPSELLDSPAGRTALESVQGVSPSDSLRDLLASLAGAGRWGAVVSTLEFAVDSEQVKAESTFWVLRPGDRWVALFSRNALVNSDVPVLDAKPDREGTPIGAALLVLESLAASPSTPEISQRRQRKGIVAEAALGRARAALDRDLARFALPVLPAAR